MTPPYGCQTSTLDRLCRFDKRAIDERCNGCTRVTDKKYLESMQLWIDGISHNKEVQTWPKD